LEVSYENSFFFLLAATFVYKIQIGGQLHEIVMNYDHTVLTELHYLEY